MNHCVQCQRKESAKLQFGVLAETGRKDTLCPRCRFAAIDAKYSDPESIREEMRDLGIPVNRRAEKLR